MSEEKSKTSLQETDESQDKSSSSLPPKKLFLILGTVYMAIILSILGGVLLRPEPEPVVYPSAAEMDAAALKCAGTLPEMANDLRMSTPLPVQWPRLPSLLEKIQQQPGHPCKHPFLQITHHNPDPYFYVYRISSPLSSRSLDVSPDTISTADQVLQKNPVFTPTISKIKEINDAFTIECGKALLRLLKIWKHEHPLTRGNPDLDAISTKAYQYKISNCSKSHIMFNDRATAGDGWLIDHHSGSQKFLVQHQTIRKDNKVLYRLPEDEPFQFSSPSAAQLKAANKLALKCAEVIYKASQEWNKSHMGSPGIHYPAALLAEHPQQAQPCINFRIVINSLKENQNAPAKDLDYYVHHEDSLVVYHVTSEGISTD